MDRLPSAFLQLLTLAVVILSCNVHAADNIGINYGLLGDNLPPPAEVIDMYKAHNIAKLRIFDPNPDVLNALRNSGLEVYLGMKNQDLPGLAASQEATDDWFNTYVQPYLPDVNIACITVGNEVIPGELGPHVLPVIKFLQVHVRAKNLPIMISTTVATSNLATSYPPSAATLTPQSQEQLVPVMKELAEAQTPLMVQLYPYFAYASDPVNIRVDYSVMNATEVVVKDGELEYKNLFDAMYDCFVFVAEKEGAGNLKMSVTETGWPSGGNGDLTTPELAQTYNRNLMNHIASGVGTPKRPNIAIDGFIFAMFNENQKPEGVEQNFGLFYPDKSPVYELF
ncbi:PREDICTED: probable glucan endo-1,3-beta-glucosidase BG4 [Tarenaya hassleriana]|uniref:probable glucan endo-1,3-beta-glucosidase BG4 n=1 Tax=Tarenaya hassleriana TaxID=28532 RepID=UPI00053C5B07|nr:PREDICTED: probable glucan endo-1,3-beta-glucosidase BG4 [Tarenaya hassleriana]